MTKAISSVFIGGGPGAWFDQHIWLLTISDPSLAGQQPLDQGQGVVFSLVMDVIVVQCQGNASTHDKTGLSLLRYSCVAETYYPSVSKNRDSKKCTS